MAMASLHHLHRASLDPIFLSSAPLEAVTPPKLSKNQKPSHAASPMLRREALLVSAISFNLIALSSPIQARERRNRNTIPLEEFMTTSDGLKYYDVVEGKGPKAEKGSIVQVHFDCLYRGVTAVSSRESKLLAGNRIIAQPYEFTVGSPPGKERKREFVDNANGLYSAQAAPKPPKALYTITEGMKVGGKRTVIVPPDLGYGQNGLNEIPPGAPFELNVELLQVMSPATAK
ncbi:peptidyl-prolyl cis-trans isomerase FKBP18, chloroplastic [Dioscorea cayenensis subsp. rotundata]|uniref:peptidylprolyl isomerase n=1 Tax=Dioscorea cayennensis subsp. rotundata TaxID=55577 RepID=A0AB40BTH4_DIOCR|nr:peptidyl-prolyl cis-trans isomerase FKBP18, chloroplastic [Dioscorea cayenensis subsp. rotundata]